MPLSPKEALKGTSPYQVVTGLLPRSPLATYLRKPNKEQITTEAYVKELMDATERTWELVRQAQEKRAEQTEVEARKGRIPRELEVGETVLLRRPPPLSAVNDGPVSRKLQPKTRFDVAVVLKKVGRSNYIIGDPATLEEWRHVKQPLHADPLVPLAASELTEPVAERNRIEVEGRPGVMRRQALDGKVLVTLASVEEEDEFAYAHRRLGAAKAGGGARGVWLDLTRHDYRFV